MKTMIKVWCVGILAAGIWMVRGGSEWCDKIANTDMKYYCRARI